MSSINCKNCALANLCLPFSLNENELETLGQYIIRHNHIKREEALYRKGDTFNLLYAVRSGAFKSTLHQHEREQVTGFYLPGEMFGFDGIHGKVYTTNMIAITESSVCEISFDNLLTASQKIPSLQQQVYSIMSQEIVTDIRANLHQPAEIKLLHFFMQLSERFKRRKLSPTQFELPMPRQDIANYLGLANETVSRLLTKLQDDGVIKLNKREVELVSLEEINKALAFVG